jgi:hypothetical protein
MMDLAKGLENVNTIIKLPRLELNGIFKTG